MVWVESNPEVRDATSMFRRLRAQARRDGELGALGKKDEESDAEQPHIFGDLKMRGVDAVALVEDAQAAENHKFHKGVAGRLVNHLWFERMTMTVILSNAVWIGFDTEYTATKGKRDENLYKGEVGFIVAENVFATFFTLEILVRACAYRVPHHCLCDGWFVFDFFLVALMACEIWAFPAFTESGSPQIPGFSVLRLLRLLRIARVAKLMRAFPELMMILRGVAAASKAVFWTCVLLVIITFTWSILFTSEYHQGKLADDELGDDQPAEIVFGSMGKSMKNLLIMGTILDDVTYCADAIRASDNIGMLIAFVLYILLSSFTMLNMLVGILVDVVQTVLENERTQRASQHASTSIQKLFFTLDRDGSGTISRQEFMSMRENNIAMKALEAIDIRKSDFAVYAGLLLEPDESGQESVMTLEKLKAMTGRLRPNAAVTALDLAEFECLWCRSQDRLNKRLQLAQKLLNDLDPDRTGAQINTFPGPRAAAEVGSDAKVITDIAGVPSLDILAELHRRYTLTGSQPEPWAAEDREMARKQFERGASASLESVHSVSEPGHEPDWCSDTWSC